jgi:hypothetical protein
MSHYDDNYGLHTSFLCQPTKTLISPKPIGSRDYTSALKTRVIGMIEKSSLVVAR